MFYECFDGFPNVTIIMNNQQNILCEAFFLYFYHFFRNLITTLKGFINR